MLDRWADDLEADAISVDNVKGAYLATEHLLREGHRKIAFVQGLHGTNANEGRLSGFLQAMKEGDVPAQKEYIVGDDFGTLNGYIETKSLLQLAEPPTAIFAAGDLIALRNPQGGVLPPEPEKSKRKTSATPLLRADVS